MQKNASMGIARTSLIFSALVCILIISGILRLNLFRQTEVNGRAPIRKIWVTIKQDQHDQLFEQFRKFSNKNAFTIQITQTDPTGENFLVQMTGKDIELIGVDSGDPGLFKIGFYNVDDNFPAQPQVIDNLVIDLQEFITEIPNATFIVKE